jgi:glycerophosphoryl diester phosphodiesterase
VITRKPYFLVPVLSSCLPFFLLSSANTADLNTQAVIRLLQQAHVGRYAPILSPYDPMLSGINPGIYVEPVQRAGFPVVVWTVNNPERMAELLGQRVDGIISDRPDLLHQELLKAQRSAVSPEDRAYFARFDAEGHRGGRDLRPENTLPAFESGLDNLITTIETDTGVTADHVSLISHEQFINPQTCRSRDGQEYSVANRVWIKDITIAEAQKRFVCDRVFRGPQQKNDLALSPAAVAFAKAYNLQSPYVPTYAGQLFQFVAFYVDYYKTGPGKSHPQAGERWRNAEKVRFNLETKLTPESTEQGHTFGPTAFVDALCGAIKASRMEARSDVQSFDFRTLDLVGRQHPEIRTVFLMESVAAAVTRGGGSGGK